jgi:hypothetical protein
MFLKTLLVGRLPYRRLAVARVDKNTLGHASATGQRIRGLTLTSRRMGTSTPAAAAGMRPALSLRDSARRRQPVPNTDSKDALRARSETRAPMRHPSIRQLFDYWNERRGRRPAPDRADIEPGAIRRALADTFILSLDERAGHPFRIAGTRVCAAFGRELKNEAFLDLWAADCRKQVRDLLNVVANETVGVVASARGASTAGTGHDVELLVLPLTHRGRTNARVLGALAPRDAAYWLGACTLGDLTLGTMRYLGPGTKPAAPPIAPAQPEGRIRHGFIVYDGGQT